MKDNTYKLSLLLANKLEKPISVSIVWTSGVQLDDDAHDPSPTMKYDFATINTYEPYTNYAKSVYQIGRRISSEEPQPLTFYSGKIQAPSKHVSLSVHVVIAEDRGKEGIVASLTVLRCNDLVVE